MILFTGPHSELNAGLAVVCASRHQPILDLENLDLPVAKDAEASELLQRYGAAALRGYRHLIKGYLATCLDPSGLSSELASTWIQTGLALTPFAFAETRFSPITAQKEPSELPSLSAGNDGGLGHKSQALL